MNTQRILIFFTHLYYLGHKELLAILKDPRMRIALIMPVFTQGLLFGYVANYNLDSVPYAVVDASRSEASQSLIAHFDGSPAFSRTATLAVPAEIEPLINSETILMALIIPADFEARLARGETAPVEVITDGRNALTSTLATGYAAAIIARWNAERLHAAPAITLTSRTWYNENQITRWTFLPSIIAMISFVQVIMLAGLSIAREREQGTFDQLLVTPLAPVEILIGKALPPMLIGLVQSTLLLLISLFWFEIPFAGSFLTLYLTLFLFILRSPFSQASQRPSPTCRASCRSSPTSTLCASPSRRCGASTWKAPSPPTSSATTSPCSSSPPSRCPSPCGSFAAAQYKAEKCKTRPEFPTRGAFSYQSLFACAAARRYSSLPTFL